MRIPGVWLRFAVMLFVCQGLACQETESTIPWDMGDLGDDQLDVDSYFEGNKKIVSM